MILDYIKKNSNLFKNISSVNYILTLIIIISFAIRIVYVFYFTDYKNYLVSDMGGYWERATGRYNGDIFPLHQWTCWGTFFHFYLAFVFKILALLNLFEFRLEAVLLLNIIYSVISIFFFYRIAHLILRISKFTILATILYAFSYPFIYLNTFVLSENLSLPLLIVSVYILLMHRKQVFLVFLNGILLGLGIGFRPALVLLAVPFLLYIIFAEKISWRAIISALVFGFGVFIIVFLVIVENNYISKGELKTLAGNGGIGFFIAQCKPSVVKSFYQGLHVHIATSIFVDDPTKQEFTTDHPIHDQSYFYKLGVDCIRKNPNVWIENFKNLKYMFFGPLFPSMLSAKWFESLIKLSNYLIFFMTLTLGFIYYILKDMKLKSHESKQILLLCSILFFIILTMYFFTVEMRYLFPGYFIIYLLFFYIMSKIKKYRQEASNYFMMLILVYFILLYFS